MVIHPTIWLAIGVYMEARGEPFLGKLGVAFAKINRVKDPRWPGTVEDVIWQPYQFSWTNPGDPNRMKLDKLDWKDPAFVDSHKAAVAAWYELLPDPTGGANHYLAPKVLKKLPSWYDPDKITVTLGNHEFLKL